MATELASRRNESRGRTMTKKKEEPVAASILQNSDDLKDAMMEASKGGKKKIVGLYMPDGSKIDTSIKVETHLQQARLEAEKMAAELPHFHLKKQKDKDAEVARRAKVNQNLAEVAQTYNSGRHFRQARAQRDRKTEDELDDDDASRKARAILAKASDTDKQNYSNLFDFFDVDKDRNWGSIEFAQRVTDIGFPTGVEDAANLLYFAGVRDVDRITYNDFIAMMPKLKAFRRLIEKDAMKSFSRYDDGSGFIKLSQLREVLEHLSGPEPMDPAWMENICRKADREGTGRIAFDYMIRALFNSKPIIEYERDVGVQPPVQRLMNLFGRMCGVKQKKPVVIEDEEEEDDRA